MALQAPAGGKVNLKLPWVVYLAGAGIRRWRLEAEAIFIHLEGTCRLPTHPTSPCPA